MGYVPPADLAGTRMDHSPTVRGRRLTRELKRLREASGITPDEAARRLDFSKSKLYRIENGRSRVDADDLEDMLDLYGVRSPQRDALIQLGRESRRRGWWTGYKDVFTGSYVGLESEASEIRRNASLVPGIFQTPDYARAVIAATGPWLDAAETERRVAARLARQQAMFGTAEVPRMHVVLDESAIRRQVGGPELMRRQMSALAEAMQRPQVTIQVLPFKAGACPGIDGDFVILAFPDPEDPPVVYVEGMFGDLYLESKEEIDRYTLAWTRLTGQALNPAESAAMLADLAKDTS
jgi:transcriptional regulator with XRE-family HTH domain